MTLEEFLGGFGIGRRRVVLPHVEREENKPRERGVVADEREELPSASACITVLVDQEYREPGDDGLRSASLDQLTWELYLVRSKEEKTGDVFYMTPHRVFRAKAFYAAEFTTREKAQEALEGVTKHEGYVTEIVAKEEE